MKEKINNFWHHRLIYNARERQLKLADLKKLEEFGKFDIDLRGGFHKP